MYEKTRTCTLTRYGSEECSCWTVSDDETGTVRGNYSTELDVRIAASDLGYAEAKSVSKPGYFKSMSKEILKVGNSYYVIDDRRELLKSQHAYVRTKQKAKDLMARQGRTPYVTPAGGSNMADGPFASYERAKAFCDERGFAVAVG